MVWLVKTTSFEITVKLRLVYTILVCEGVHNAHGMLHQTAMLNKEFDFRLPNTVGRILAYLGRFATGQRS